MPLYFFDFSNGSDKSSDEEGLELADLDEAEREAMTTIAEMAKDHFKNGPGTISLVVRNHSGVRSEIAATMTVSRS